MWFLIFALVSCELSSGQEFQQAPSAIYFPGPVSRSEETIPDNSSATLRSLEFARRLNSLQSREDYLSLMEGVPEDAFDVSNRNAGNYKSITERRDRAGCQLEDRSVPVIEKPNPSLLYIPDCIKVKRCGGCCQDKRLVCEANATAQIKLEVLVATVNDPNGKPMKFKRRMIVPIEEHTMCDYACAVKEKHCNKNQVYIQDLCSCECKNKNEKKKCKASEGKVWSANLCTCQCQEIKQCTTKFYFDQNTCRCERESKYLNKMV